MIVLSKEEVILRYALRLDSVNLVVEFGESLPYALLFVTEPQCLDGGNYGDGQVEKHWKSLYRQIRLG